MKLSFGAAFLLCCAAGAAQPTPPIEDLKKGRVKDDTSFVYRLPFEKGRKYLLVQAYQSNLSHKGELALDFKMKTGSPVCAARSGVVISVRADSRKGGLKKENLSDGNYIIIRHADDTYAHYWHLDTEGVLVSAGDEVKEGHLIARSGNTGYTAFPHLHFEVRASPAVGGNQLPARFRTPKGIRYLRPLRWYRAV